MKLSDKRGLLFDRNTIGKWETNKRIISADDRRTLIDLLILLVEYQGIGLLEEADVLLETGQYRRLNEEEIGRVNPAWKTKADAGVLFGRRKTDRFPQIIELYSSERGNEPINLAQQRLLVSSAFGSYFTGLLERPNVYLDLDSQVDCPIPARQAGLTPLQRIFWLLEYARGPRTIIIAGEGGMGKSTLAAKIIRCLYHEQAVDIILGDSAKSEHIDPATKELVRYKAGYYSSDSFYKRICSQLGLPALPREQAVGAIKERLAGRRAIIVVDNLETVREGDEILEGLRLITSRDVRAVITTRVVRGVRALAGDQFVVHLKPLSDAATAERFLLWHIEQYQYQHPALRGLQQEIHRRVEWLIERTGGIPLLMQLILSDVARYSWNHIQTLPSLFGKALLNFLYETRWSDLGLKSQPGEAAREFLKWISREQYRREGISSGEVAEWARQHGFESLASSALSLLLERFLIVNRDPAAGDFSIYPSLAEFVNDC